MQMGRQNGCTCKHRQVLEVLWRGCLRACCARRSSRHEVAKEHCLGSQSADWEPWLRLIDLKSSGKRSCLARFAEHSTKALELTKLAWIQWAAAVARMTMLDLAFWESA